LGDVGVVNANLIGDAEKECRQCLSAVGGCGRVAAKIKAALEMESSVPFGSWGMWESKRLSRLDL